MRLLALVALLCAVAVPAAAEIGLVAWLHPQENGRFGVESAYQGAGVRVQDAEGAEVTDAASLRGVGWEWAGDGFWQTPRRAGGGKLRLTVTGLPPGMHRIFLRYFSQPRLPGNPWWFALQAGLEDGREVKDWLDQNADRIVAGTGGHDPKTVYETCLGTVGTEQEPVTRVSLWVQRYEWSELGRLGSIRIETTPSMHASTTSETSPNSDRVRAALLANGPQADGKPAYGIAVVSGALKVRPKSFAALAGQRLPAAVSLAAAKGEYESRQVLIYSPERDLTGVTLECSPLTADGGPTLPASELLLAPVGYCPYAVPSDPSIHGYWPEPILTFLKEFSVKRGDVQSLWYRVHVPREAQAGVYRGTLTVRPKEAPECTLPVELRVWDFERPKWPRLRVVVGCNQTGEFEMSYGLNPSTIYGFEDKWIEGFPKWAAAGVTAVNLGYIWGKQMDQQTKLPTAAQLDEWVSQIGRRYRAATEAGLREACYVYMFDEATAEWDPALRMVSARLRKEFPDLLLLTTAARPWHGAGTIEDINAWCPLTPQYTADAAAEARRQGRQVWWYTCNSPEQPFANLMMTCPAMDARLLMGFMAFAYHTDGFLYYATRGGNWASTPAITAGPYTNWPLVDNAHDHLYQKGPDGPLPSLRLEAMRDGLEDYDLLWQARADTALLRERGLALTPELTALQRRITPLFAPGNDLVTSLTSFSQDPQQLETARRDVGQYVEQTARLLRR
jgi:hypothetical protein